MIKTAVAIPAPANRTYNASTHIRAGLGIPQASGTRVPSSVGLFKQGIRHDIDRAAQTPLERDGRPLENGFLHREVSGRHAGRGTVGAASIDVSDLTITPLAVEPRDDPGHER